MHIQQQQSSRSQLVVQLGTVPVDWSGPAMNIVVLLFRRALFHVQCFVRVWFPNVFGIAFWYVCCSVVGSCVVVGSSLCLYIYICLSQTWSSSPLGPSGDKFQVQDSMYHVSFLSTSYKRTESLHGAVPWPGTQNPVRVCSLKYVLCVVHHMHPDTSIMCFVAIAVYVLCCNSLFSIPSSINRVNFTRMHATEFNRSLL